MHPVTLKFEFLNLERSHFCFPGRYSVVGFLPTLLEKLPRQQLHFLKAFAARVYFNKL